jgi:EamA domain-containing membrane protein RarD
MLSVASKLYTMSVVILNVVAPTIQLILGVVRYQEKRFIKLYLVFVVILVVATHHDQFLGEK